MGYSRAASGNYCRLQYHLFYFITFHFYFICFILFLLSLFVSLCLLLCLKIESEVFFLFFDFALELQNQLQPLLKQLTTNFSGAALVRVGMRVASSYSRKVNAKKPPYEITEAELRRETIDVSR
jgi:hypothetical protein